jgi:hypothetical protein
MNLKSRAFYAYISFVILYVALTFLTPPNKAVMHQYHLSTTGARFLSSSVVLPLILIWFAAFYGFSKLLRYAEFIKRSKDGKQVAILARGVEYLALWLPISSCVSAILNIWTEHHPGFANASTIISGYVSLVIPFLGFITISVGARNLVDNIRQRPARLTIQVITLLLALSGVIYCYFAFTGPHIRSIYHLPSWLLVSTIIVPYLFMWFVGMMATSEIALYAHKASGVIYRSGWRLLAAGLGGMIITSVSLQYIVTLTDRLSHLKIGVLMGLIYLLLLAMASSFVLIALGAKKLQRIEEV